MQIKLENLKKTYISVSKKERTSVTAVNGVSLEIPENSIYGIIGKSGAGKSSLVRLVSLLETPDEGAVYYGDKRVDNLSKNELIAQRRKIGMIFQNFNLFSSRTAGKNVAYPLEIAGVPKDKIKAKVKEMLALVGLSDRENAPISTLSGGQKQRVAIARALATEPSILFCDEATSALDPNTTRQILALIKEIQKKMNLTVVMITHQMEVVRDACESVAVIESGRVVECGKVKDIFSNPQTETTRDFIKNIAAQSSSRDGDIVKWTEKSGSYLLHFVGGATGEPILSKMAKEFDVSFNILAAGISHLPDEDVGYMETDILGTDEEIERVVQWLLQNNVRVQKK
ncbi:methionine ABC transporter ATP-binding protein [uncultured Treponema sp.]|uniref:methionine ABC transporter ATP-binding protein n=1 Tax=uncultured Treponema sp. TaxID=162155 RepID=UPI0025F5F5CB|nr:methionine ABC transporter ATP-binding protein [uncultured Treponema sp.]